MQRNEPKEAISIIKIFEELLKGEKKNHNHSGKA